MLKSKDCDNGDEYLSFLADDREFILNNKNKLICPECSGKVIFVDANYKIKHFRHLIEADCHPEPETIEHIKMKIFIAEQLKLDKKSIEVNLIFAKPDVFMEKGKIAIEVQHSNITEEIFLERNKNYTLNGIYPLWIFHEDLLKEDEYQESRISALLKKAHEMYFGRVYVYKKEGYIVPVHFKATGTYVEPNDFSEHGGYWKWYKKQRKLQYGTPLYSLSILKIFNDRLMLNVARFYDKQFWK